MTDLREVFEMTTKQVEPDLDVWREQEGRQRRSTRAKKIVAFAVAAAIGVAAVAVILATRGENTPIPASGPGSVQDVARGFIDAYGAYDSARASTYLASDADLSGLILSSAGFHGTVDGLERSIAWSRAVDYRQTVGPCEEVSASAAGTSFKCPIEFQSLRSDELGLGPFSGSLFDVTVRDEKVVRASLTLETKQFSPQVWEPFATWVSTVHPKDAAAMYESATYTNLRLTDRSIRLWERRTQEYVQKVTEGKIG